MFLVIQIDAKVIEICRLVGTGNDRLDYVRVCADRVQTSPVTAITGKG
jgi:hypothetical protein